MSKLSEELKGIEQRYLDNVASDLLIFGNDLNLIHNYLMNNIDSDLKTLNSVIYEKDSHKKEFVTIVYTASLNANIHYYNQYFSIHEIKGTAKTGELYNWIEKREYKLKQNDHKAFYFDYDIVELTSPRLNDEINYNFVVDRQGNVIYTNSSFFDLSKLNDNLKESITNWCLSNMYEEFSCIIESDCKTCIQEKFKLL